MDFRFPVDDNVCSKPALIKCCVGAGLTTIVFYLTKDATKPALTI